MMVCYVAVPSRLTGMKTTYSRRDKLAATAVSGAIGAVVCTPRYVLGRIGLLMLGSRALLIPGIVLFVAGLMLEAGATSAVKAKQDERQARLRAPSPWRSSDMPRSFPPGAG
jgi:hypothetical protein